MVLVRFLQKGAKDLTVAICVFAGSHLLILFITFFFYIVNPEGQLEKIASRSQLLLGFLV